MNDDQHSNEQEPLIWLLCSLPDYPFLPCLICKGIEGCDHTVPERARATYPALITDTRAADRSGK